MAKKWMENQKDIKTWDDMEVALVEQYVRETSESKSIRSWWTEKRKATLSVTLKICEILDFKLKWRNEMFSITLSFAYSKTAWLRWHCPERLLLENCKAKLRPRTEVKSEAREKDSRGFKDEKYPRGGEKGESTNCYNCRGSNHYASNCPDKEKDKRCYKCQDFGHILKGCKQEAKFRDERYEDMKNEGEKKKSTNWQIKTVELQNGGNRSRKKVLIEDTEVESLIASEVDYHVMREDLYDHIKKNYQQDFGFRVLENWWRDLAENHQSHGWDWGEVNDRRGSYTGQILSNAKGNDGLLGDCRRSNFECSRDDIEQRRSRITDNRRKVY